MKNSNREYERQSSFEENVLNNQKESLEYLKLIIGNQRSIYDNISSECRVLIIGLVTMVAAMRGCYHAGEIRKELNDRPYVERVIDREEVK